MDHSKTIRNIAVVLVISAITAVLAYVLRIYVARTYSVEDYGLLYAMLAFFSFVIIIVDAGLFQSVIKKVAEYRARKDEQSIKNLFYTAFIIQTIFAVLLAVILILFSNYINIHFFHNTNVLLFYVLIFWILTYPLSYFVIAYMLGYEKTTWWAIAELIKIIGILLISIIAYQFTPNIIAVGIGYALTNILVGVIFFIINIKFFIPLKFRFKFRLIFPELFTYGVYIIIGSFASIILAQTDTLMITYLLGLKEAGIYQAAVPLASILVTVITPITAVLLSRMSNLWAQKKKREMETLFVLFQKYILIFILPVTLILALFSNLVITVLFSSQYVAATNPLILLSFAFMISAMSAILMYTLISIGEAKKVMYIVVFGAIVNVIGCYFLIHVFRITGAAISTLIASIIMFAMLRYHLGKKIAIDVEYRTLFKTIFATTVFIITIYFCKRVITANYLIEAALCILIAGALYILTLFITGVVTKEDVLFVKKIARKS